MKNVNKLDDIIDTMTKVNIPEEKKKKTREETRDVAVQVVAYSPQ